MYKRISQNNIDHTKNISRYIVVSVPLIFAILNICIHWCKAAQCNTIFNHFKQDPPPFTTPTNNGLAIFITVAFLIEALRNYVQVNDSKKNTGLSDQDDEKIDYSIITMNPSDQDSEQISNLPLNMPFLNLGGVDELRRITPIEILLRVIYDHSKSLENKVVITELAFEQATQLIHTLWKLLNMISDFLSITGVPIHEKTYAEFLTIACCWLRICSFIEYRSLQLNTIKNKEKSTDFDWPKDVLINKAVYLTVTNEKSGFANNRDELPQLNKVLFCCLMLTNLSILLNGVMKPNSKEYQMSQFSINGIIMFIPYMSYLKVEKDLNNKIQNVEISNKQKKWIQEHLPEIFSIVGTLQAVALIAKQTKVAFACVVINAALNTIVSILDMAQYFKYQHHH